MSAHAAASCVRHEQHGTRVTAGSSPLRSENRHQGPAITFRGTYLDLPVARMGADPPCCLWDCSGHECAVAEQSLVGLLEGHVSPGPRALRAAACARYGAEAVLRPRFPGVCGRRGRVGDPAGEAQAAPRDAAPGLCGAVLAGKTERLLGVCPIDTRGARWGCEFVLQVPSSMAQAKRAGVEPASAVEHLHESAGDDLLSLVDLCQAQTGAWTIPVCDAAPR